MTYTIRDPGWKRDQGYARTTLTWLRDAIRVLGDDARRPENSWQNLGADLDHLTSLVAQLGEASERSEVEDAVNTYDRIRSMLIPYASSAIDVVIPTLVSSDGDQPPTTNSDQLQQAEATARTILRAGDPLRAEIEREAAWARSLHAPSWWDSHLNLGDETPEVLAQKRTQRVAAWARTALHRLSAPPAAPTPTPAQPHASGMDAPGAVDATAAVTVGNTGDTQRWLLHAVTWLAHEAALAGAPPAQVSAIGQLLDAVHHIGGAGYHPSPDEVAMIAQTYEQLREALAAYEPHAYASPPIDVLVPSIVTRTHPSDVSAAELPIASEIAMRLLPPADLLRNVISAWSRGWLHLARPGYETRLWDPVANAWRTDTSEGMTHMRARRLAAWARAKLAALFPQDAQATATPRQMTDRAAQFLAPRGCTACRSTRPPGSARDGRCPGTGQHVGKLERSRADALVGARCGGSALEGRGTTRERGRAPLRRPSRRSPPHGHGGRDRGGGAASGGRLPHVARDRRIVRGATH